MEADQLPRNWALATIEDVAEYVQRGKSPKYADFSDLPVINQKCVRWHGLEKEFVKYVHEDQIAKWDEIRLLKKGDLLWNSTGTGTIGRACLYKGVFPRAVVDSHVTIVRSNSKITDPGYMHFFVMSPLVQKNIEAMQSGSTNQVELSKAAVLEKEIPVPPLNEQRRIVDKIESLFAQLDHGEDSLRDVQKLLARYRQSVLKAAVTGQLTADWRSENARHLESGSELLERILQTRRENWQGRGKYKDPVAPDTSDLPELPEGWVWASVDQILRAGLSNGRSVRDAQEGFPVLRLTSLKDGAIDLSERKIGAWDAEAAEPYLVRKGDVLVSRGNGSKKLVGRGGLIDVEPDPVAYPDTMIRIPVFLGAINPEWFLQLWNSPFMRSQIEAAAKTTAGIYKINQTDIRSFKVPLPVVEEQNQIVERVYEAFDKIRGLERWCASELTRSAALRQSILKDAFSGKLVPQDPDDEPASELLARIRAERDAAAPKKRTRKKATA